MQHSLSHLRPILTAVSKSTRTTSQLVKFPTCDISDALLELKHPHGGYIPDIYMFSPSASELSVRICGPAYTVRMVPVSDTTAPKLSEHFVDTTPEGSVIVIDAPPELKTAVWGGLMSAGAQARSAKGVVISGRCRDFTEHPLNFPIFARGHSTLGQLTFVRSSEINIPLTIKAIPNVESTGAGDFPAVTVQPGDWIVADSDGVVCVPRELEDSVIDLATKGRYVDDLCMEDIKAGKGVRASLKLHGYFNRYSP